MDVAGPLTCLWADLLNKEAEMSSEDVLLLVQRALVLVGSTSHAINKRETNLFGSIFLLKGWKQTTP